jgi:chromosome segregation ATPase
MIRAPYRQGMGENDSQWLTFRELAEAVGISPRAAEARARRNIRSGRWAHRTDNDARRTGRVLVPAVDLAAMRQGTRGVTDGVSRHDTRPLAVGAREGSADPVIAPLRAALQAAEDRAVAQAQELAGLRERLAHRDGELAGLREALRRADLAAEEASRREAAAVTRFEQAEVRARRVPALEAEAAVLREGYQNALGRVERVEQEVAGLKDAVAREAARADAARMAQHAAEAGRNTVLAALQAGERRWEAAEATLASRDAGGPLARMWHAIWNRRSRQ